MILSELQIKNLYRKRAAHYDWSANLYYLIGFREQLYRKTAVSLLQLQQGDTVIDIGCGTGLNFSLLQQYVGPGGRIIGVDITREMLAEARARIQKYNWRNVELIHADATSYKFPEKVDAIISSFAITLASEYDQIIKSGNRVLSPGKRLVVLDLKQPEKLPLWLVKLGVLMTRPFGVSLELADRRPWESIEKYFSKTSMQELYYGFAYIATGEKT